MTNNFREKAQLIWNIADVLRGSWKQHEYQDVILPLVVVKRLDSILAPTKPKVLQQYNELKSKIDIDPVLKSTSKVGFYNVSEYDFEKLLEDPDHISGNFKHYLNGFSENIQDIVEKFEFDRQLSRLEGGNLLYLIIKELNKVDLHPDVVDNHEMGSIFEELIRRFSEQSNETAGEHYSPRDVVRLAVEILLAPDKARLEKEHIIKTVYDCACGTGGMLSIAKEYIQKEVNDKANIYLYGQELNPVTYAMCKSDMLIKGENPDNIKGGEKDHSLASTLSNDQFFGTHFDYMLTNPPFGVDWKKDMDVVEREAERGYAGRFGAGLPRSSDGQLLFLQHLLSKMRPESEGGSRIGIVFNGSPLFTGNAGQGESEIRRWILEHDWLEAIVALPDQLFFNTGIPTYLWFITNRKSDERKDKVQIIDARAFSEKMRKSLGNKRNFITEEFRKKVLEVYADFSENEYSKIFSNEEFGYRQITVERPLKLNFQVSPERIAALKEESTFQKLATSKKKGEKGKEEIEAGLKLQQQVITTFNEMPSELFKNGNEFVKLLEGVWKNNDLKLPAPLKKVVIDALSEQDESANVFLDSKGKQQADTNLRDTENVPLNQDVYDYFAKEVKPYVPDAWIDESKTDHKDNKVGKVGYEILVTRFFYKYEAPRSLDQIQKDIEQVESELDSLIKQM
ncbi:SAM-dependent DNA methyltransferase [Candidatus Uhrbacteria bacterium]|nr:SAM-dependent DNA methyltransferase [Candidatus Uhrbacteria bacterium]